MPVIFYHILHVSAVLAMVASLAAVYFSDRPAKLANMLLGISGLLVVIAGVGLIHKMGYAMTQHWILGKLGIWAVVTIVAPIVAKRAPQHKHRVFVGLFALLIAAVVMVYLK